MQTDTFTPAFLDGIDMDDEPTHIANEKHPTHSLCGLSLLNAVAMPEEELTRRDTCPKCLLMEEGL